MAPARGSSGLANAGYQVYTRERSAHSLPQSGSITILTALVVGRNRQGPI